LFLFDAPIFLGSPRIGHHIKCGLKYQKREDLWREEPHHFMVLLKLMKAPREIQCNLLFCGNCSQNAVFTVGCATFIFLLKRHHAIHNIEYLISAGFQVFTFLVSLSVESKNR